jgi:hypothetical protein
MVEITNPGLRIGLEIGELKAMVKEELKQLEQRITALEAAEDLDPPPSSSEDGENVIPFPRRR